MSPRQTKMGFRGLTLKLELTTLQATVRLNLKNHMKPILFLVLFGWAGISFAAQNLESRPDDPAFEKFHPVKAPLPEGLLLKNGDRLAICGDSITEQKEYSRIMETYLTVCEPQLGVAVRQYGWSGETASGFL